MWELQGWRMYEEDRGRDGARERRQEGRSITFQASLTARWLPSAFAIWMKVERETEERGISSAFISSSTSSPAS